MSTAKAWSRFASRGRLTRMASPSRPGLAGWPFTNVLHNSAPAGSVNFCDCFSLFFTMNDACVSICPSSVMTEINSVRSATASRPGTSSKRVTCTDWFHSGVVYL